MVVMLRVRFNMEVVNVRKRQPDGSSKQVRQGRKCTLTFEGWTSAEEGNQAAIALQVYLQNCGYDVAPESEGPLQLSVKVASTRRGFELYDVLQQWGAENQITIV